MGKRIVGLGVAIGAMAAPLMAMADNMTIPSIGTTDIYSGGTAIMALMGVVVGICVVVGLFRRAA